MPTRDILNGRGDIENIQVADLFASPNSKYIPMATTLDSLLSDDFGGNAVDLTKWDIIDGGLAANTDLGLGQLVQGAIGSGVVGITDSVSASALSVAMGIVSGAERWYLSKQTFAGKEDIQVVLSKSQANVLNSIFIGLVEIDPKTLVPILNPNLANEFTNRGGCQFGLSATTTAYHAEAIGDSSPAIASGAIGVATAWSTTQEALIEIDARDIIVSTQLVDSVAAKVSGASRVSTQVPNDKKLYKLVMLFKNTGVPTATTVVIQRILVVNNYEHRVQISSGEGDQIGGKAIAANIVGSAGSGVLFGANLQPSASFGAATFHKLTSGASTNATSVKATAGNVSGGFLRNRHATLERFFKFYNKATAPTVGTDVPILTIGLPPGASVGIADIVGAYGIRLATGIAYAITGAYADADTTVIVAGDVDVNLIYT